MYPRHISRPCKLLLLLAAAWLLPASLPAADTSGLGKIAIPDPAKPVDAESCVEPVEIMRREHMKFLDHQRDVTVLEGERDSKYSLVGCIDCHNPASPTGEVVRYEDPRHFCAECHRYSSVRIDCFECHADRGLARVEQGRLDGSMPDWHADSNRLSAATLARRLEDGHVD